MTTDSVSQTQMQPAQIPQPAYLVYYQHPGIEPTCQIFTHDKLLTARKAAMSFTEKLLAELWLRGDYETVIEVRLVELTDEPATIDTPVIARIYQLFILAAHSLTASEEKERLTNALDQLHQEYQYYLRNDYSMGFGCILAHYQELGDFQANYHLLDAAGYVGELMCVHNRAYRTGEGAEPTYQSFYEDRYEHIRTVRDALIG